MIQKEDRLAGDWILISLAFILFLVVGGYVAFVTVFHDQLPAKMNGCDYQTVLKQSFLFPLFPTTIEIPLCGPGIYHVCVESFDTKTDLVVRLKLDQLMYINKLGAKIYCSELSVGEGSATCSGAATLKLGEVNKMSNINLTFEVPDSKTASIWIYGGNVAGRTDFSLELVELKSYPQVTVIPTPMCEQQCGTYAPSEEVEQVV